MPMSRTLRRAVLAASLAAATTGTALVAAAPADAAPVVRFVATTGSDTVPSNNPCTSQASPCRTVTRANAVAVAGDTISVAPGTYTDRPVLTKSVSVVGSGPGVVFQGGSGQWALGVNTVSPLPATTPVGLSQLTLTGGQYGTGGALPVIRGAVTATDVDITNSTSIFGGGVYVGTGSLTMVRGSVTGNTATATAANQGWGGGIYTAATGSLSLSGTTVSGNKADGATFGNGYGGGLFTLGPVSLTNGSVKNNTATATTSGGTARIGYAGGVATGSPATGGVPGFTATGTTFSGNTADIGGALWNTAPVSLQNTTFDANTAQAAGAIYANAAATLTGGAVTNNKATVNFGGGIWATTGALVLDGTDAEHNSAPVAGGAVAASAAVTATVRNHAVLSSNTSQSGGAVFSSGTLVVNGSSFSGNAASFEGGAIYNGSSTASDAQSATITGTDFTGNSAAFAGGAIAAPTTAASLTVTGGSFSTNSAVGGGAIYAVGTSSLASTTLSNNTATQSGGGAVFNTGALQVTDSTLDANTATHTTGNTTGLGGAIYSGTSTASTTTQLTVKRSTISHNQAYAGAAVSAYSTGSGDVNQTSVTDSTITANDDTSTSGAFFSIGGSMTVARSTITANTVAAGGYSVFAVSSENLGVAGTILSGNGASACNVAATNGGSNLVGTGTAACGLGAAGPDPQLGALAANGGPTKTQLPGPASPALDRIAGGATASITDAVSGNTVGLCGGTDQRGTARPQGAKCDIGSVEAAQTAPVISGASHLDVTVGSASGATTYTATGSPQPTFSATNLPAGLTLVDNGDGTATLSGTPTGPGGEYTGTVTATNEAGSDSHPVTFTVRQAPTLSGPSGDTFTVGQAGGPDVFTQTGGYPAATLSTGSQLPDGVTFTPGTSGGNGTGTLAGTPSAGTGGVYPITVKGTNGTGPDASWPFTLTVDEAPSLSGPSADTYTVGTHGSTDLTVGGFPAPTLSATGLPAGLAATAHGIGGTPTTGSGGTYDATVTATNGVGADATHAIHVVVDEAPAVAGPAQVRLVAGQSGTATYAATGFPVPTLAATGALPSGVTFHDNGNGTGSFSGTPASAAVGSYNVTVTASNGIGQDAAYAVTIQVVPAVSITTSQLPNATYGSAYDAMVVASGGTAPYTFTVASGTLPAGLSLGTDGHLSGTPTGAVGTSTFTVQVADGSGQTAQRQLSITVTKGATTLTTSPQILVGGTINVLTGFSAVLTGGVPPHGIAGQTVVFKAGTTVLCSGITAADGSVLCQANLGGLLTSVVTNLLAQGVTANYAGNATWNGTSAPVALISG